MKKCPFCAEEIQDEARFCKHCKTSLDKNILSNGQGNLFTKFIIYLNQKYPAYRITLQSEQERMLVITKEYSPFNGCLFIILLCIMILPALIYLIITLINKSTLSLTIHFDNNGNPISISNSSYKFLIDNYNKNLN